jgi:type III pantothenate kinase
VRNAYAEPQALGSDRWAALIGAHALSSHHVGIIDCGSALTVDLLRADGTHDGGYILPGLRMMQQCLLERTGRVAAEPAISEQTNPGQSTRECLAHGALRSATALIDRLMSELPAQYDNRLEWLLTGGDAIHLRPHLREPCHLVPDLVLQGLACLARGNE